MTVPAVEAFDHVHLMVADRAAAERWYREVLGFTRVPELEMWTRDGGPLTLRNAADTVHLALFERQPSPSRTTIAMRVAADAWRGARTCSGRSGGRSRRKTTRWLIPFTSAIPTAIPSRSPVTSTRPCAGAWPHDGRRHGVR